MSQGNNSDRGTVDGGVRRATHKGVRGESSTRGAPARPRILAVSGGHLANKKSMLPTKSRFVHSITVRQRRPHTYMSKWTCSRPLHLPVCPPVLSICCFCKNNQKIIIIYPFVRNRTATPYPVPQFGVLRASCKSGPTCSQAGLASLPSQAAT